MQTTCSHCTPSVITYILLLIASTGLPLTTHAAGTITITKEAAFARQLSVPEAVRKECNLPARVSEYVKQYADANFDKVVLAGNASAKTPGLALSMNIASLTGTGGGAWTGPKL